MVHFVGAGPGAPDLITLRGAERLKKADVVIYAGSLVNPVLLGLCSAQCRIFNSAEMTLEQVLSTMEQAVREQKQTVRLHHPDGGPNPSPGAGEYCLFGRAWGDHGDFPVRLFAGWVTGSTAPGGLYPADPCGSGV